MLNVILKRLWFMKTPSMFAGFLLLGIFVAASFLQAAEHASAASGPNPSNVYPVKEGFIDVNGLFLYYTEIGQGPPRVIGLVRQELLSGIKTSAQYEKLRAILRSFPDEPGRMDLNHRPPGPEPG
jgi:hypothetical protein